MARQDDPDLDVYKPTLEVYCSFIDFCLSIYTPDTVTSYLKRINTAAVEKTGHNIKDQLNRIWIKRTFVAAARRLGHSGPSKRLPLTVDVLTKIRPEMDFSQHNDRALWAILCVGVFALARIGELIPGTGSKLQVTRGAVTVRGDKGTLSLRGTKTDREMKGVQILFFRNDSACCPVTALLAYLATHQGRNHSPLFVDNQGRKISQSWVVVRMRTLLNKIGLRGEDFSGISLRRGGAQTLVRLKANDKIVMCMGRWTSSCFNRYLTTEERDIESWQRQMAGAKQK